MNAFAALGGLPRTVTEMFDGANKANDGRITFDEFMSVLQDA